MGLYVAKTTPAQCHATNFSLLFLPTVPKGGWEMADVKLENAALREAFEEGLNLLSLFRLLS